MLALTQAFHIFGVPSPMHLVSPANEDARMFRSSYTVAECIAGEVLLESHAHYTIVLMLNKAMTRRAAWTFSAEAEEPSCVIELGEIRRTVSSVAGRWGSHTSGGPLSLSNPQV